MGELLGQNIRDFASLQSFNLQDGIKQPGSFQNIIWLKTWS